MAEPFIAEIRIITCYFVPKSWAWCDGQILPINQNTALFSIVGATYGGDGKTTFALPDLGGKVPVHPGQGPGLTMRNLGETGGSKTITLLNSEMPRHQHPLQATNTPASTGVPGIDSALARSGGSLAYQSDTSANLTNLHDKTLSMAGQGIPHNNMQPFLSVNFAIALAGIYPPRG